MTYSFNTIQSIAIILGFLLVGYTLQKKIPSLKDNFVPAPFIGGLACGVFMLALTPYITIQLDTSLMVVFVAGFFASVGLRSNKTVISQGFGKQMLFLAIVVGLAFLQNVVSIGLAAAFGLGREGALLHGSLAFMGDAGLGPLFTELGGVSLPLLGGVSTLAVIVGTLLGGQVFRCLQGKADLSSTIKPPAAPFGPMEPLKYLFIFGLTVGLGFLPLQNGLGKWITPIGGAFLFGLMVRLVLDKTKWFELQVPHVNLIGNFSLSLFLTFVFATLKWDTIAKLTASSIAITVVQTALVFLVAVFVIRKLYGNNALAAYIATGLPGFALGIPASTMSTLQCVSENMGAIPMVLFVVPPVGAWLIALLNPYIIQLFF
ncbi:MAG: Na+/glutamate symporter [Bacillota bacterium]|nr:MAG: Na+/glutamate symporter [Bacillota bacterium]